MTNLGGRPCTVVLRVVLAAVVPLVAVMWVDSCVGIVAVLQSTLCLAGVVLAALVVSSVLTSGWRLTAAAGTLFGIFAVLAAPSLPGGTVAPGRRPGRPHAPLGRASQPGRWRHHGP